MAKPLTLSSELSDFTSVSNLFIDTYMAEANGEFVKVYLYLLRFLNAAAEPFSVSMLADRLNHTENDVLRALSYWEKKQLLTLEQEQGTLTGIRLRAVSAPAKSDRGTAVKSGNNLAVSSVKETVPASGVPKKHSYSPDELNDFSNVEALKQTLFITEQYLGKNLTATEMETILYIYDKLHFSQELMEYLIEYCVSKGSKSIRYIEKVAIAWAEGGIKTVRQAKDTTTLYHRNCSAVQRAFGIKGRNLVEHEVTYIEKWTNEWAFTVELVSEACCRTIQAIHQPSFEYADSILSNWQKKGIHHSNELKALDEAHLKRKNSVNKTDRPPVSKNNQFNNFTQRDYDYDKLEQQLLNRH